MPDTVKANIKALDRFERRLAGPLADGRAAYVRLAVTTAIQGPMDIMPMRVAYTSEVYASLAQSAREVIPYFARMVSDEIGQYQKADFETLYSEWINTTLFQHSVIIAETATSEIAAIISQLLAEGAGDRQVADAIWDYSNAAKWQARMIARTETHQAAMYAKKEQARIIQERSGIEMVKFWNAVEDGRTRESHWEADARYSKGIAMNEKFNVDGDMMDRPGDPSAGADNLINCRCVLTVRPKGS